MRAKLFRFQDYLLDTGAKCFKEVTKEQINTYYGIAYILNKYVKIARDKSPELIPQNISPHSIRHSKAMNLLHANVNIVYIRDLLGHSSVTTTETYARADTSFKRESLEKANPLKDRPAMPQWTDDEGLMEWLTNLV